MGVSNRLAAPFDVSIEHTPGGAGTVDVICTWCFGGEHAEIDGYQIDLNQNSNSWNALPKLRTLKVQGVAPQHRYAFRLRSYRVEGDRVLYSPWVYPPKDQRQYRPADRHG